MKYGLQLLTANKFSLFCLGRGVREQWCVAHPCLVWENPPRSRWWYEFRLLGISGFDKGCHNHLFFFFGKCFFP